MSDTASVLEPSARASVAADVQRLIKQSESGQTFDSEWAGHAYDVQEEARAALAERLGSAAGLADEIESRIERFARASATANMYMRLVVTDTLPDLPDYAPCDVGIYDGVCGIGTDFSKVIQRSTIYGTLMTSVNVTDLKAYFESGKKRHLLVYMGTDRMGDMKALDRLMVQLPAILEAAGFDKKAIAEIIAAIQAGNLPPAAVKAFHQMVEVAQLKALAATAPTPQLEARIEKLEISIKALASRIASMPSVPAIFARAMTAVATASASLMARALPARADNDNKPVSAKPLADLVRELRGLARDKTISPEQRREIAAILRDMRAWLSKTAPQTARIAPALVSLNALVTPMLSKVSPPAFVLKLMPSLARAALSVATPAFVASVLRPAVLQSLLESPRTLPVANRIERVFASPHTDTVVRMATHSPKVVEALPPQVVVQVLAAMRVSDVVPPRAVAASVAASRPTATAPQSKPVQTEPIRQPVVSKSEPPKQETPKSDAVARKAEEPKKAEPRKEEKQAAKSACGEFCRCAEKGVQTAALKNAVEATPQSTAVTPLAETKADGSLVFRDEGGRTLNVVSKTEVEANIKGHAEIDRLLATAASNPSWEAETRAQLAAISKNAGDAFNHVCGAGCDHGPKTGIETRGQTVVQEDKDLKIAKVDPDKTEPAKGRPKRTLRPA